MKRPPNIRKKLWRKASKKQRKFIIWHEYQHELYRREHERLRNQAQQ